MSGGALGAVATRIDDVLRRGEADILSKVRVFLGRRFGALKVNENPLLTQPAVSTKHPTSPDLGKPSPLGALPQSCGHPT